MSFERTITTVITPTPEELAKCFCNMDGDKQAIFFNSIAEEVKKEWVCPFCFQLQSITDSKELLRTGRNIMRQIGEYSGGF